MKKSNIILTSFLVFIFGSTLYYVIDSKKNEHKIDPQFHSQTDRYPLPDFSTVVVREAPYIVTIHQDDENYLTVYRYFGANATDTTSAMLPDGAVYHISGDTLFVDALHTTDVYCQRIVEVIAESSTVNIYQVPVEKLQVKADDATMQIKHQSEIDSLYLTAVHSVITFEKDCRISSFVTTLSDTTSVLSNAIMQNLSVKKDESSRIVVEGQ
ncbi:MAG: hypothetical protein LBR66_05695 [Candidatus Symbiothrix sp.]|jgi:hypothetical protein|nr:hypothetical protein [Candidatus Symbiothrix sp.]